MEKQEMISRWETLEGSFKSLRIFKKIQEKIVHIAQLRDLSEDAAQKLKFIYSYVDYKNLVWSPLESMEFDIESRDMYLMPVKELEDIIQNVEVMLNILIDHPEIEFRSDKITLESVEHYKKGPFFEGRKQVIGDLCDVIVQAAYHFFVGIMHSDPCCQDHRDMLSLEPKLFFLGLGVVRYLVKAGQSENCPDVARLMYSLIYYKTPEMYSVFHGKCYAEGVDVMLQTPTVGEELDTLLKELSGYVFSFGNKMMQDTIKLYDIYHLAVTDDYMRSMDGMLSFLKEAEHIQFYDQFEFNRALAQLGLCAFRAGRIAECHTCLSWLYGGGCVDILLGQASTHLPIHEIRRRPMTGYVHTPHNLHIDLHVLEGVYALCTMLLEHPGNENDSVEPVTSWKLVTMLSRKKLFGTQTLLAGKFSEIVLSKYLIEVEHNPSDCERILVAIRTLRSGDVKKAIEVVERLDLWRLIKEGDKLLEFVKMKIQDVAFLNHYRNFWLSSGRWSFLEVVYDATTYSTLTKELAVIAAKHETIFEGSNYNFPTPLRDSSTSDELSCVSSLLVWDERLSIPSIVLDLFLSESLQA